MSTPSWEARALLIVLSVIAGCTDVIGYLDLDGLFTNHITGNLLLLAAHAVGRSDAQLSKLLAVPVYMAMVGLVTVLAGQLRSRGLATLFPLLLLQLLLLAGFLALGLEAGPHIEPNAGIGLLAGMCGVSAMAVQGALAQLSLKGMPPTAIMTGNAVRFALDATNGLGAGDPADAASARARALQTLPVLLGFAAGCALGAAAEAAVGVASLAVPVGLALAAVALGLAAGPDAATRS